MKLDRLAERLGYRFVDPRLLEQALTHPSFAATNNQRLEYLGDAVLNCVIAQSLFERFPQLGEGPLSRLRANLVRQETLCQIASDLGLGEFLRLGEGERKSGGIARASNLADALEALVGAVHLDGGFAAAEQVTQMMFSGVIERLDPLDPGKDPKTRLQELLMSRRMALPVYSLLATRGADHRQEFDVECVAGEPALRCRGSGTTRRAAEQAAAAAVLDALMEKIK